MAPDFHDDPKAIQKQAEESNEANADYSTSTVTGAVPPPQLPDYAALADQQSEIQGGNRPQPEGVYGDEVVISDDGTRVGKGQKDAADIAAASAKAAEKDAAKAGSSSSSS